MVHTCMKENKYVRSVRNSAAVKKCKIHAKTEVNVTKLNEIKH